MIYDLLTSAHVGFVGGIASDGAPPTTYPGGHEKACAGAGRERDVVRLQATTRHARDPYPENLEAHSVCLDARMLSKSAREERREISAQRRMWMQVKERTAVGVLDAGGARSPRSYAAARDFVPGTTRPARRADRMPR